MTSLAMQKKSKIINFEVEIGYIHQTKAKNMYNKDSGRKSQIFCKKMIFFNISIFHLMLEDPQKFLTPYFRKILQKKFKMAFLGPG